MIIEEMKAELDRANAALVERIGRQPYLRLDLTLHDSGKWQVGGAYLDDVMRNRLAGDLCDTPRQAFNSIFSAINAMPSTDERVTREYLGKVADAIDFGTKHSIDDKYVTPLRGVTKVMTDNLLTKEPNT